MTKAESFSKLAEELQSDIPDYGFQHHDVSCALDGIDGVEWYIYDDWSVIVERICYDGSIDQYIYDSLEDMRSDCRSYSDEFYYIIKHALSDKATP